MDIKITMGMLSAVMILMVEMQCIRRQVIQCKKWEEYKVDD